MKRRKPTQKDVAKAAGVSQALVSLVFTNAAVDIAETTRALGSCAGGFAPSGVICQHRESASQKQFVFPFRRGEVKVVVGMAFDFDPAETLVARSSFAFYDLSSGYSPISFGLNYAPSGGLFYGTATDNNTPNLVRILAADEIKMNSVYEFTLTINLDQKTFDSLNNRTAVKRPQYHGSSEHRGLNLLFLDGHARLIRPAQGDWRAEPTFGTATNGGYFYHRDQFKHMKENPGAY